MVVEKDKGVQSSKRLLKKKMKDSNKKVNKKWTLLKLLSKLNLNKIKNFC